VAAPDDHGDRRGCGAEHDRRGARRVRGGRREFIRTPKFGIDDRSAGSWRGKRYGERAPWGGLAELVLGLYCACAVWLFWGDGQYAMVPFLALYALGFLTVGSLTIAQSRAVRS